MAIIFTTRKWWIKDLVWKHLNKSFVRQHDQSDCGVACLLSVVRFHGGNVGLENLGGGAVSKQNLTLLGLLKTAQQLGFEADGLEADGVVNLVELHEPAILHVVIDEQLSHYVVYYPHRATLYNS